VEVEGVRDLRAGGGPRLEPRRQRVRFHKQICEREKSMGVLEAWCGPRPQEAALLEEGKKVPIVSGATT